MGPRTKVWGRGGLIPVSQIEEELVKKNIYRDKKTINDTFFGKIHWDDCNSTLFLDNIQGPPDKSLGAVEVKFGFLKSRTYVSGRGGFLKILKSFISRHSRKT